MGNKNEQPQPDQDHPKVLRHQPIVVHSKRKLPKWFVFFIVVLLMAASAAAAYWYAEFKDGSASESIKTTAPVTNSNTPEPSEPANTYFVSAMGYPLDTGKKVAVELGIPNEYQAIDYITSIQDGGVNEYFAENFNASMGRWKFGYAGVPNGPVGEIGIVHVHDSWLTKYRPDPYEAHVTSFKVALNTPTQKQAYINEVSEQSTECAKDPATGFVLGEFVNVCYTLSDIRQAVGSYSPYIEVEGYGEKDGVKLYIYGTVRLYDGKEYTEAEQTAFQQSDTPAAYAVAAQNSLIESLKQTKITISDHGN